MTVHTEPAAGERIRRRRGRDSVISWLKVRYRAAVAGRSGGDILPVAVLISGMMVNFAVLLSHSSGVWFWADDWDLLFLRGTVPEYDAGLLAPHNNHWFTAHIVVYRVLFSLFGMGSYTPYAVAAILVHLGIVAVLYGVLRRVGAGPWISVLAALMVAFFGLGANAEIYAASINHSGALLFGLVAVFVSVRQPAAMRELALAVALLVISIMFGLTGLAMFVLVGCYVFAQGGLSRALRTVGPPAAVFGLWYVVYGRTNGVNSINPSTDLSESLPRLPGYVWSGLVGTLGEGSGLAGAGPLLALALVGGLAFYRGSNRRLLHLAWAGVLAELFQLAVVGAARFDFGPAQLGTSHYSYINIVLLAPSVALLGTVVAERLRQPRWGVSIVVTVLFLAYALHGLTAVRKWQDDFTILTGGGQSLALGVKAGLSAGQKVLTDDNPDPYNGQLVPKYLGTPQIMQALPDREPSEAGRLNADSYFFTGVGSNDFGMARSARVSLFSGFEEGVLKSGCQRLTTTAADPILRIETGAAGTEIVLWSTSTNIKTRLERNGVEGPNVDWKAEAGPVHIATSATDAVMYVSFNGVGEVTLCLA